MGFLQFAPKIGEGDMARVEIDEWFAGRCIKEVDASEVGPNTRYPVGFDLLTFAKIYNRVRSLSFSENFQIKEWIWDSGAEEWNDSGTGNYTPNITKASYDPANDDDGLIIDAGFSPSGSTLELTEWIARPESRLSCAKGVKTVTIFSPFDIYEIETQIGITTETASNPSVKFYDDKFYPRFYLRLLFLPLIDVWTFSTLRDDVPTIAAQDKIEFTTFKLFGEDVTFYGLGTPTGDPGFTAFERAELISFNLEIDAAEYAQYKDADGNPLYDEDTGERI
jgi:hypothetical protein